MYNYCCPVCRDRFDALNYRIENIEAITIGPTIFFSTTRDFVTYYSRKYPVFRMQQLYADCKRLGVTYTELALRQAVARMWHNGELNRMGYGKYERVGEV